MDKLFLTGTLKSFIKRRIYIIDGTVFRLHYQVTALFLTVCSILLSTSQFLGDPIQCIQTDDVPKKILNNYCWIEGTFTLPKAFNKVVGQEVVYPGVDQKDPGDDVVVHAYYQWVCLTLLFQGTLFYIPKLIWSSWEGGKMRTLLQELNCPVVPLEERQKKFTQLVQYFRCHVHQHTAYAIRYILCELIALVNVIGQIYLVDAFLGGEFTTYGLEVLKFSTRDQGDRVDPMIKIFPRLTKCTFHRYGSSGDVMKFDALCLLPFNIINEKIYIALWFWLIFLSILTTMAILYRIVLLGWPRIRFITLHSFSRLTPREHLHRVIDKTSYGDWFILFLLAKNMEPLNYKEFLNEMNTSLTKSLICQDNNDAFHDNNDASSA